MRIQGSWVFNKKSAAAVTDYLFNPSQLVRLIPDVHHVIRKSGDHICCLLHPQISALGIRELQVEIIRQADSGPQNSKFQLAMTTADGRQALFNGQGFYELTPNGDSTILSVYIEGDCHGRFKKIGPMFLETQMRASLRRFFQNLEALLEGRTPFTTQPIAARRTSRETVAIVLGVSAFIIGWIFWRWWRTVSRER